MKTAERAAVRHLLDPLTAEEIEAATKILKEDRGLAASARFVYVTLREPAKDDVLRHWPVMPVTRVGFQLRADGFFDGNPALDVPPAEHCHSG